LGNRALTLLLVPPPPAVVPVVLEQLTKGGLDLLVHHRLPLL
jgi:hypothetical protein